MTAAHRPDGSFEKRIFRPVADSAPLDPAWSPDGKRMAFVPGAPRGGVWMMQANGAKQGRIKSPLFGAASRG